MPKLKDLPLSQFNVWQRYFSKEKCFDPPKNNQSGISLLNPISMLSKAKCLLFMEGLLILL